MAKEKLALAPRLFYFLRGLDANPRLHGKLLVPFVLRMRKGRTHTALECSLLLMLILSACGVSHFAYSQKINNVDFQVVGATVRINYDIAECPKDNRYDIKLSLGVEGELVEIKRGLSGDVKDVTCGSSKMILWDVLSDRDELKGPIYFAVEIQRIHHPPQQNIEVEDEPETYDELKWSSRRSWRADKGYVGGAIGLFTPYQNYLYAPYSPRQNGFFMNTSIAYLPSSFMGITTTIYFYSAPTMDKLRITSWKTCGMMFGPLISLPIGNKIKWEFKPQIGYSMIFPNASTSDIDSLDRVRSGVAYNLSTGFRLNFGKRTCYMLNVEYLSAARKFEKYQVEPDVGLIGVSFGIAFRFY